VADLAPIMVALVIGLPLLGALGTSVARTAR
jgi:hypothetical protein